MTADQFRATLERLGLSQAAFARLVSRLSGEPLGNTTVNRWVTGKRAVPALAVVVLRLYEMLPESRRAKLLA